MRVEIREGDGKTLNLNVPMALIPSRLVGRLCCRKRDDEEELPEGMDRRIAGFMKVFKRFARENPGWVLVEIEDGDGEQITVTL